MTIPTSIGERILMLREQQQLSQREFANMIGFSQRYISQVEQGQSVPGGEFLIALKRSFHTSADWILVGEMPLLMQGQTLTPEELLSVGIVGQKIEDLMRAQGVQELPELDIGALAQGMPLQQVVVLPPGADLSALAAAHMVPAQGGAEPAGAPPASAPPSDAEMAALREQLAECERQRVTAERHHAAAEAESKAYQHINERLIMALGRSQYPSDTPAEDG